MKIVRTGPLTWGQHMFWFYNHPWMVSNPGPRPESSRRLVIPAATPVGRLQDAVNRCVQRFEALRTVYTTPGPEAPQQRVLASYEVPLLDPDAPPAAPPSIVDQPSIRLLVRTARGKVTDAGLRINKLDVDGYSLYIIKGLIEQELDPDLTGPQIPFNEQLHPIDWAVGEAGRPAARSAHAIAALQDLRRDTPRNFLPLRVSEGSPRKRTVATAGIPDLLADLDALARGYGVTVASVLHGVVAILLAAYLQRADMFLHTVTANRWQPETRHMVGRVALASACRIPVQPAHTAAEHFTETHRILLSAYRHTQRNFGAGRMSEVRDDAEGYSMLTLPVVVEVYGFRPNDPGKGPRMRGTTSAQVHEGGVDQVRFDITPQWPGLTIGLTVDTCVLPPKDTVCALNLMVGLLRTLVRQPDIAVAELIRMVTLPAPDVRGLVALGDSRFDAALIARHLSEHAGVDRAAVFFGGTGPSPVRAHLAGSAVDLAQLHERMMLAAAREPLIHVPASYRLVASPPADPGAEASWLRCASTGELSPRDGYRRSPDDDPRIRCLVEVFQECHPGTPGDPARCYAQLGGDYLLVPAMMTGLRLAGYEGAEPADFIGLASLAAIAGKLRPVPAPAA